MGFLDSVSNTFNKAAGAADRGTKTMKLKGQINDINKRRESLAGQLGALLFEKAKELPELRALCGSLFDDIAGLDAQRSELQEKIAAIEAEAAVAAATYTTYVCPTCGRKVTGTDKFCSGCGTPIDVIKANQPKKAAAAAPVAAPGAPVCATCGAPLGAGDAFCMNCGSKVEAPAAAPAPVYAPVVEAAQAVGDAVEPALNAFTNTVEPIADAVVDGFGGVVEATAEVIQDAVAAPACPVCGNPVTAGDKFCEHCGCKLA